MSTLVLQAWCMEGENYICWIFGAVMDAEDHIISGIIDSHIMECNPDCQYTYWYILVHIPVYNNDVSNCHSFHFTLHQNYTTMIGFHTSSNTRVLHFPIANIPFLYSCLSTTSVNTRLLTLLPRRGNVNRIQYFLWM